VFALTGWGSRINDPAAYLNADAGGTMHAPGFGADATEFLKHERPGTRAIGLDTAGVSPRGVMTTVPSASGPYGLVHVDEGQGEFARCQRLPGVWTAAGDFGRARSPVHRGVTGLLGAVRTRARASVQRPGVS
jgi:kynurenine formamidase